MKNLLHILIALIVLFSLSLLWRNCAPKVEVVRDTITDTITIEKPIVRESIVIAKEIVRLPVVKEINRVDTIIDSVKVEIPITQKVYSDSNYTAWVSGYHPNLDSIKLVNRLVNCNSYSFNGNTKSQRLVFGLSAGYGITPKGFQPYLGVGFTFSFYGF